MGGTRLAIAVGLVWGFVERIVLLVGIVGGLGIDTVVAAVAPRPVVVLVGIGINCGKRGLKKLRNLTAPAAGRHTVYANRKKV